MLLRGKENVCVCVCMQRKREREKEILRRERLNQFISDFFRIWR